MVTSAPATLSVDPASVNVEAFCSTTSPCTVIFALTRLKKTPRVIFSDPMCALVTVSERFAVSVRFGAVHCPSMHVKLPSDGSGALQTDVGEATGPSHGSRFVHSLSGVTW